jgi:molybdopterin converting factor small subunit
MSADADGVDGSSTDASFGSGMNNSVPELVNVNMEMVPADTPLKQGDQVFLGDER